MKIPTLLGLFLLFLLVVVFVFGTVYVRRLFKPVGSQIISTIQVSNLSDLSATVTWLSSNPIQTQAYLDTNKDFSPDVSKTVHDDRDQKTPAKRFTHLVTFKNLKPGQNYFVKVEDDSKKFNLTAVNFQTLNSPQKTTIPIVGSVVDDKLKPVIDALVFFGQENNLNSAGVSEAGNFLLNTASIPDSAEINVTNGTLKSQVKIASPVPNPLPPVILGQNSDLSTFSQPSASPQTLGIATESADIAKQSNSPKPSAKPIPTPHLGNKFDLNDDKAVNSLDVAILQRNLGKSDTDPKWESINFMDFNLDGKIDSKDLTLLKAALHY